MFYPNHLSQQQSWCHMYLSKREDEGHDAAGREQLSQAGTACGSVARVTVEQHALKLDYHTIYT